ncbi:MAG: integrating conjugative element protein [Gammaproteobacteria bacterium]|nr:integrating conjugative element protein [Gammaproteobacteria bacterium]|tara:strand:+ start:2290 stop:2814 length:525 start_codon:yes stop_codon:yes gene_type:complete
MCGRNGRAVILLAVAVSSHLARAELDVIYDSGATKPLAPLLEVLGEPPDRSPSQAADLGAADVARLLPIRSPGLTPGPVSTRPLVLPHQGTISRPFFLIGSDPRSRQWLIDHRDRLRAIGAVGMLVQAESVADLEAMAALARGLPVLPASADDIASAIGIRHIPVLISRRGIEQ